MKEIKLSLLICLFGIQIASAQFIWTPTNGPMGLNVQHFAQNDHTIFAGSNSGLYRSFDGLQWEKILTGYIQKPIIHGDSIFVLLRQAIQIDNYNTESSILLSQDNGNTWTEIVTPSTDFRPSLVCKSGLYILSTENYEVLQSTDLGQNWSPIVFPSSNFSPFILGEDDNQILVKSNNKLWLSDKNGANWEKLNTPQNLTYFGWNIPFKGDTIFTPKGDSAYISINKGVDWQKAPIPTNGWAKFSFTGSTLYTYDYSSYAGDYIFARSNDMGLSWIPTPLNTFNEVEDVGQLQNKTFLKQHRTAGIQYIENNGADLHKVLDDLTEGAVDQAERYGNEIWVGNSMGLFKYNINNQTWDTVSTYIAKGDFTFFAKEGNVIIARFSDFGTDHLWISEDNGSTWTSKPGPPNSTSKLVDGKIINGNLYLFDFGCNVYRSTSLGNAWGKIITNYNWGWGCTKTNIAKFKDKHYLSTEGQLFVSPTGAYWSTILNYPNGKIVDILPTNDYLFLQVSDNKEDSYLYKSKDGINWSWANDGLPNATFIAGGYSWVYQPHGGKMFQKNKSTYFYNYSYGLYISKDTCKTWYPIQRSLPNMIMEGDKIYSGKSTGLFSSDIPRFYGELMKGTVFHDKNGNGTKQANEKPIPNAKVSVKSNTSIGSYYFTYTKEDGSYILGVTPKDTDTLLVDIQSDYITQMLPAYYLTSDTNSIKDFAIQIAPNITDLAISGILGFHPRPGFDLDLSVFYKNKGTIPKGGKISITLDNNLNYLGSTPLAQIEGDSLVWTIDELQPLESRQLVIHTNLSASTPLSIPVAFHGYFTPNNTTDFAPSNNYFQASDITVGSFDPNDKQVWPERGLTLDEIANDEELIYTIRFQNTGTFYAEKVRLTDQLDTALNLTTFRLVGASHDITKLALHPGGLLEVIFNNIMLLDSTTNEPASHGFITFAIQRKKDYIDDNHPVTNMARIYFDYNEPIQTNTVSSPVAEPVEILEVLPNTIEHLSIAPNPTIHEFTVTTTSLSGHGMISIWDISGKLVQEIPVSKFSEPIVISANKLKSGAYIILAQDKHRIVSSKIIIENKK